MPQVTLHHGNFEVQMQISSEAPTDVFGLADQLVEFARVLVGKVTEARLADRLREELGPCGKAGNCFEEDCGGECPRCEMTPAVQTGRLRTETSRPRRPTKTSNKLLSYVPTRSGLHTLAAGLGAFRRRAVDNAPRASDASSRPWT